MVIILDTGKAGDEAQALRASLEYFGFRVLRIPIGRPNDLIAALRGETLPSGYHHLVICGHGGSGSLLLEPLAASVYLPTEPRGPFGPELIRQCTNLPGTAVLLTGCTLGQAATLDAFLAGQCSSVCAPTGYVEGNDALLFSIHYFFQLSLGNSAAEAWAAARGLTPETQQFTFVTQEV